MNGYGVKLWLLVNRYRQSQIAEDLGVSRQAVWLVLNKRQGSKRVEGWLRAHGCPEELLGEGQ